MVKQHQTAVFIERSAQDSEAYLERVARFIESVNGSNIKVDTYVISGGQCVPSDVDIPLGISVGDFDHKKMAFEMGYAMQILLSQPAFDLEGFEAQVAAEVEGDLFEWGE